MGKNQLGSNSKPRTTLVFDNMDERNVLKLALADVADLMHTSPSKSVLFMALEYMAKTPEGIDVAKTMYSHTPPRCQVAYKEVFANLAYLGNDDGKNVLPLIRSFQQYVNDFGMGIDSGCDDDFRSDLDAVTSILDEQSDASLSLKIPCPTRELNSILDVIIENWATLREQYQSYSLLAELAKSITPHRLGATETAQTRQEVLVAIDKFYDVRHKKPAILRKKKRIPDEKEVNRLQRKETLASQEARRYKNLAAVESHRARANRTSKET